MIDKKYLTHSREPFFEIARSIIPANGLVLDVGGGDGSFSRGANVPRALQGTLLDGREGDLNPIELGPYATC